jgi:hypothetical protein
MMPRSIVAIISGQAWRLLGMSLLGVFFGAALVVFGLVTGFLAIIGLVLFVIGCIGVVGGFIRVLNPTGHAAITRLGRTPPERMQTLAGIEHELSRPETWRARTMAGGELFLSPTWLVFFDSTTTMIAHRNDVLWLWQAIKKKRWSSSQCVRVHTRWTTSPEEIEIGPMDHWVMPTLISAFPHALVGFDPRWQATPRPYLAAEVDRRRAMQLTA